MNRFTRELAYKSSAQLLPEKMTQPFTIFLPNQMNLEGHWEVAISEMSSPSMYQNVTDLRIMFFDEKILKSSEFYYLEPGLHPSITDNVETMSTPIQKRYNHSQSCITVEVSRSR